MAVAYEAPLRCTRCLNVIEKKPGAKIPKYCGSCRTQQQNDWREKVRNNSGRRS